MPRPPDGRTIIAYKSASMTELALPANRRLPAGVIGVHWPAGYRNRRGAVAHGSHVFPGRPGPRLADRHARRRKMPRTPLPPLAGRPACTPCSTRPGSVSPTIEDRRIVTSVLQRLPRPRALLPLPAAADAAGGPLAAAAVRSGRQPEPLRRQGGRAAAGRAARLLLLHADALCLAHAGRLFRPARPAPAGWLAGQTAGPASRAGTGPPPTA